MGYNVSDDIGDNWDLNTTQGEFFYMNTLDAVGDVERIVAAMKEIDKALAIMDEMTCGAVEGETIELRDLRLSMSGQLEGILDTDVLVADNDNSDHNT